MLNHLFLPKLFHPLVRTRFSVDQDCSGGLAARKIKSVRPHVASIFGQTFRWNILSLYVMRADMLLMLLAYRNSQMEMCFMLIYQSPAAFLTVKVQEPLGRSSD